MKTKQILNILGILSVMTLSGFANAAGEIGDSCSSGNDCNTGLACHNNICGVNCYAHDECNTQDEYNPGYYRTRFCNSENRCQTAFEVASEPMGVGYCEDLICPECQCNPELICHGCEARGSHAYPQLDILDNNYIYCIDTGNVCMHKGEKYGSDGTFRYLPDLQNIYWCSYQSWGLIGCFKEGYIWDIENYPIEEVINIEEIKDQACIPRPTTTTIPSAAEFGSMSGLIMLLLIVPVFAYLLVRKRE